MFSQISYLEFELTLCDFEGDSVQYTRKFGTKDWKTVSLNASPVCCAEKELSNQKKAVIQKYISSIMMEADGIKCLF